MRVVSSKEFAINQRKFYTIALNERIFIKRGKNVFYLANATFEEEDDDEAYDLADARATENDENISVDDYLKAIYERAKCTSK